MNSNVTIDNGMSDDDNDRDIDIESDDDDNDDSDTRSQNGGGGRGPNSTQHFSQAEKRAHHNALERKRRDHIKDSFNSLRESVPSLAGDKNLDTHGNQRQSKASRAQILRKAAEFIQFMRRKNQSHQSSVDDLKRQNNILDAQIRQLEQQRDSYVAGGGVAVQAGGQVVVQPNEDTESEEEEDEEEDDDGHAIDEDELVEEDEDGEEGELIVDDSQLHGMVVEEVEEDGEDEDDVNVSEHAYGRMGR